jgi:hypothetical protein
MHAQQENNFYRFAKDKAHYDDESIKGLQKAIASKIDGVKNGKIFDADGTMEGDVIDNITIQTKGKGLKKGETYHYDNTAGASRYISKLVENLKPVEKSTTGNWDITKNGFGAYLTGQGLDPQRIFEELDVRQTDDPAETRKTTQRREKLKELLPQYADYLQKKGFDFTSNDNDWDDEIPRWEMPSKPASEEGRKTFDEVLEVLFCKDCKDDMIAHLNSNGHKTSE